jgi:hypothetical protein
VPNGAIAANETMQFADISPLAPVPHQYEQISNANVTSQIMDNLDLCAASYEDPGRAHWLEQGGDYPVHRKVISLEATRGVWIDRLRAVGQSPVWARKR